MIGLLGFFGTLWGRVALGAGIVVALIGLRAWDVSHQRKVGAHREQVRVETVGKKVEKRAQQKREQVERAPPSDVEKALRKFCRDCDGK